MFKDKVSKNTISDYNRFVHPDDEMWLGELLKRCRQGKYDSVAAYLADAHKIESNAQKYNGINGGICAHPEVLQQAMQLWALV